MRRLFNKIYLLIFQCWNGRDAGRYTNTVVHDGLQHQEYNPEVPVDVSRYPGDAQINQQIRALKSITQKIENAHKGLDVEWPVEGQHGDGNVNYLLRNPLCMIVDLFSIFL